MIIATIAEQTTGRAAAAAHRARLEGADMIEIRADVLHDPDPTVLRRACALPAIWTVRPRWEGGAFGGGEAERVLLLRAGAEAGFDYVDVEFRAYKDVGAPLSRVVLSYHDFEGVPVYLERLAAKMRAMEPFLCKISVTPRSTAELLDLIEFQQAQGFPVNVVAMGPYAEPMRVAYRAWGAYATYACVDAPAAPGQMPVRELRDVYGVGAAGGLFDEPPALFAVVGNPVEHSRSPQVHNRMFRERGVAAMLFRWRVDRPEDLPRVLGHLAGAAVTLPYKEVAARLAAELDADARRVGAVNTIVRGRGYNTDVAGARAALDAGGVARGARVLILGAGGAARAFAVAARERGARVVVTARHPQRARPFADEIAAWSDRARVEFDALVQCTPVGMAPDEAGCPFPAEALRPAHVVIESVYTPEETALLRGARAAGARTVPGSVMFHAQAEAQNALFVAALSD